MFDRVPFMGPKRASPAASSFLATCPSARSGLDHCSEAIHNPGAQLCNNKRRRRGETCRGREGRHDGIPEEPNSGAVGRSIGADDCHGDAGVCAEHRQARANPSLKAAAIYNEPGEGGTAEEWRINPVQLLSQEMKLSEAV